MTIMKAFRPRARWQAAALAFVAAIVLTPVAWAMRVSPMVAELTTSGAGSIARIEVGNAGAAAMPFEAAITRIEFMDDGTLVETPADEDFLVFPPQGLVPVGGRQVVRVQWVGEPNIDTSRAYYLMVRQLPVATDVDKGEADKPNLAVTVLYTMKALLVVAPPGAEPDVHVVSVEPVVIPAAEPENNVPQAPQGVEPPAPAEVVEAIDQPGVRVVVGNRGKRYALMSGATWVMEGTGIDGQPFSHRYDGGEISRLIGVGYVAAAGGQRTFTVPTSVPLDPAKPITIRFAR
ncbi:hypothetical protein NI456_02765 [Brevundimonas diminuta]|uniref:molecular chaperone n=1 Tax=Brevundimonas TaxID=41275 RepID=UPI000F43B48C|nr:molecular chaperone [Brevundimonas diminuta]MCO8017776.1 hypothetical protein [Brevundimonas diminuta]MCO8021296.1 hypothetical protein [Brevundimonas diminuta]RJT21868.1 molecular chaperone [Chakrabartia godavariana]